LVGSASTFEEKESMRVTWKAKSISIKNTLSETEIRQARRVQKEWEWINQRLTQHFGEPEASDQTEKKNNQ